MQTYEEIRLAAAVLRHEWKGTIEGKGGRCEICDRWGKINPIQLRAVMVKSLHWLHRVGQGDWVHIPTLAPKFVTRSYAFASLKHWGFVEQHIQPPPTKEEREQSTGEQRITRTSGLWRVTSSGTDFICNGATAPKTVYTYNDQLVDKSGTLVTARECAHEHFNYDDMMGTAFNGDYDGLNNN